MDTQLKYNFIKQKLLKVRSKELKIDLQSSLLSTITISLSIWSIAVFLESYFKFSASYRNFIFWFLSWSTLIVFFSILSKPLLNYLKLLNYQDDEFLATRVGKKINAIGDKLLTLIQLYKDFNLKHNYSTSGISSELADAFINSEFEPISKFNFDVIIDLKKRKNAFLIFIITLFFISSLVISTPINYKSALNRIIYFEKDFNKTLSFTLDVITKNKNILKGNPVEIIIEAKGAIPRNILLTLKVEGEVTSTEIQLNPDSSNKFIFQIPSLKKTTEYFASFGGYFTKHYNLKAIEKPEIISLNVKILSPSYSKIDDLKLPENSGDINGLKGSIININAKSNIKIKQAYLYEILNKDSVFNDTKKLQLKDTLKINLNVIDENINGKFKLTNSGEYYINLVSYDGESNSNPIKYKLNIINDQPPNIELFRPNSIISVDKSMIIPTDFRITDDYGFSSLKLFYKIISSKYGKPDNNYSFIPVNIPEGNSSVGIDIDYLWDLTKLKLVPEDELEFYFEVTDNDIYNFKKSITSTIKVRFPSFEDVMQIAQTNQSLITNDLKKLLNQAQNSQKKMQELNRELLKQLAQNKTEANWEQQNKLSDLLNEHEVMEKRINDISNQLNETAQRLQEARAISPETLQKYLDLQNLFQQIKDPEIIKQLQDMQQSIKQLSPEQLSKAMKNFKFNEEQFRNSIERTMKLLDKMITEQKVDELVKRSEDIAKQQEDLKKELTNSKESILKNISLADKQNNLSNQAKNLKVESQKLSDKMNEMEDSPKEEMKDANNDLQDEKPDEQMESASEDIKNKNEKSALEKMDKSQKSTQKFRDKMKSMKQKMQENSKRQVLDKMKKSLEDMINLSKDQEQLKRQVEITPPNSQQFRNQAKEQSDIQRSMENITDQVSEISNKSFAITPEMSSEMGQTLRNMQDATKSLESRNGFDAKESQSQAMSKMNQGAQILKQAIQQIKQGSGSCSNPGGLGSSSQQRLQQAAAQQQMLNSAMQQQSGKDGQSGEKKEGKNGKEGGNGKDGQGDGGLNKEGSNGSQFSKRLVNEQKEIKKTIEDLNKEQKSISDDHRNSKPQLDKVEKDIDEVISDIESGNITPETLLRQEKILSRLLEAMKSERERDFDNKRESKPGVDVTKQSPVELRKKDIEPNKRKNEIDYKFQGYSKDYEEMIRIYLEYTRGSLK